jgi:cytochrome c556
MISPRVQSIIAPPKPLSWKQKEKAMKTTVFLQIACVLTAGILFAQRPSQGEEFKKVMLDVQAQVKNFTEAYNAMDMNKASAAIDALHKDFEQVEVHFQKAQKADAVNWAKDAKTRFAEAQAKMKRKDIAYSLNLLELAQKNCKACHDAYKAPPAKGNVR